jgi:hypothetical protein
MLPFQIEGYNLPCCVYASIRSTGGQNRLSLPADQF